LGNKNSNTRSNVITDKDYFGSTISFRIIVVLCFSFTILYSLYSIWQVNQWTKKQRINVIRLSERSLSDLSQQIIRASIASEPDFVAILKKYSKNKPHIRQVSFKYKDNQVFTASSDVQFDMPAMVEKVIKANDERVNLKVSNGIIDFGELDITTNSDFIKKQVWESWADISVVVSVILLIMLSIMYASVRKSLNVLRAIAVLGNQNKQGNLTARIVERGTGEALAASRAVNIIADVADNQFNSLSNIESSMKTEVEKSKSFSRHKENAEIANSSKSEYLSKISEEFRPPLNSILALTEMSVKPEFKAQEQHFIDMIHASAIQLHSFIDSVVDISKIETDSITNEKSIFDLNDLYRVIQSSVDPLLIKENKSFEIMTDSDIPQYLIADEKRIRQVILSLICDLFSGASGNKICLKTSIVKTDVISVTLQFSIYTMQTDVNPFMFSKSISETEQSTAESLCNIYGKSGIGRVVTKKLIRAMEGKLDVRKENKKVSSYIIDLRLDRPSKVQLQDFEKVRSNQGRLSGKTLRVLLAESHLINRYVFELVFFHKGLVTIKAENGEEALKKMREEDIDFAILDMQLPKLDGLSVAKEWRKNEKKGSYLPIILTSNDVRMETLQVCEEVADFVESKPVSPYKLLQDIEMYMLNPTEEKRPVLDALNINVAKDLIDSRYFNKLKNRGEKQEIKALVDNFCNVFEDEFEKLKSAMSAGEINLYRTISQRLKGGTNTIGATALGLCFKS